MAGLVPGSATGPRSFLRNTYPMVEPLGKEYCADAGGGQAAQVNGMIFGIQHFSIHDGPGIRTTVFMKGCPLRCLWCHNPEGMDRRPVLSFTPGKCVGCGQCFRICPKVHQMADGQHGIDRSQCDACGKCARECCGKALEIVGRETSAAEVVAEVLRDESYYQTSGGGITLSGGEPLAQVEFARALLKLSKDAGLHCALETNGCAPYDSLEPLLPLIDLILFDYKETDPEKHRLYTGQRNEFILERLRSLHDAGARIVLRCPIIPGLNDREDHFAAIAQMTRELGNLVGAQIMPYHRLGGAKAARMGLEPQHEYEQPEESTIRQWKRSIRGHGGRLAD